MGNEESYFEQLKDPRWQKKRLEIMTRDNFSCRSCSENTETLNVHHLAYIPKLKLWEIDSELLITLCEFCHNKITVNVRKSIKLIREECSNYASSELYFDILLSLKDSDMEKLWKIRKMLNDLK